MVRWVVSSVKGSPDTLVHSSAEYSDRELRVVRHLRIFITRPEVGERDDVWVHVEQPHQLNLAQCMPCLPLVPCVRFDPLDGHLRRDDVCSVAIAMKGAWTTQMTKP